ncbi:MAG: hypothetical protein HZB34_03605 [Nitrospirae bacterium]|nr:hypothetical protein [Nitrospirota bacterium]
MPWIESHTVLVRHRKVVQGAHALNITPVYFVGHLTVFWHTVLEQQEDGDLTNWPDEMIAHAAAYTGDPSAFVAVLQSQKLLDGKVVHDWLNYAGRYLKNKYKTANPGKLKAIYKLHSVRLKSDFSPTKVCLQSAHLTIPNLTRPNQPNQREEKTVPASTTATTQDDHADRAETFWKMWPANMRKVAKGEVEKWFQNHKPTAEQFSIMLAALEAHVKSEQWTTENGQWIPLPMTWLNQERWTATVAPVPTKRRIIIT